MITMLCHHCCSLAHTLACHQRLKVHTVHCLHWGQPPLALPDSPAPPSCGSHAAAAMPFLCLPQARPLLWPRLSVLLCLGLRWALPDRGIRGKLRRAIPQRLQGCIPLRGRCLPAPCWLCPPGVASGPDCLAQSFETPGPSVTVCQQILVHLGSTLRCRAAVWTAQVLHRPAGLNRGSWLAASSPKMSQSSGNTAVLCC